VPRMPGPARPVEALSTFLVGRVFSGKSWVATLDLSNWMEEADKSSRVLKRKLAQLQKVCVCVCVCVAGISAAYVRGPV